MSRRRFYIKRFKRYLFNRKGHRVHSPYAFNLITNVLEEKLPFYCYQQITKKKDRHWSSGRNRKITKCLIRLINFAHPDELFLFKPDKQALEVIAQAFQQIKIYYHPKELRNEQPDYKHCHLIVSESEFEHLYSTRSPSSKRMLCSSEITPFTSNYQRSPLTIEVFIFDKFAKNLVTWHKYIAATQAIITVDATLLGISIFDDHLNKKHYKVFL